MIKQKLKVWIKRFTLIELFKGLGVTFHYLLQRNYTTSFPEEKTPFSNRHRGILALRRYPIDTENHPNDSEQVGEERCIACKLCEAVCPAQAITIETHSREDGQRRTTRFDIDMFKCVNCGLCAEACPVDSIVAVPDGQYVITQRGQNILDKSKLLAIGDAYEARIAQDRKDDEAFH